MVYIFSLIHTRRRFHLKYPVVTRETSTLILDLIDRRSTLRRRLQAIGDIQPVYMPCVPQLVAKHQQQHMLTAETRDGYVPTRGSRFRPRPELEQPEKQPLFLPHQLSIEELEGCVAGLADIEARLREGQMRSALDALRVQLHIRSRLITFKARNSRHQRQNQKSNEKIEACQARIKSLAAKYRAARHAKLALSGSGEWEREWRPLLDRDIRGLSDPEPQVDERNELLSRRRRATEGRRVLSWIWLSVDWDEDSEAANVGGMAEGQLVLLTHRRKLTGVF